MTCSARLALGVVLAVLAVLPGSALAANITVNTTADAVGGPGCSLREAILAANAISPNPGSDCADGAGADTIILEAGSYNLGLDGPDENDNVTGDLDVSSPITIDGAGAGATTINGAALDDRILHITTAVAVEIRDLRLANGGAPDGSTGAPGADSPATGQPSYGQNGGDGQNGGAILNDGGSLTLTSMVVANSSAGDGGDGGAGQTAGAANPGQDAPQSGGGNGGDGGRGGAVNNVFPGALTAVDTSFTGNRGGHGGAGGDGGPAQDGASGAPGHLGGDSLGGPGGTGGGGGAVLSASGTTLEFTRVTFDGNAGGAGGRGGGAGASGSGGPGVGDEGGKGGVSNGGSGGWGGSSGAIFANGSTLALTDSRLTGNQTGLGGAGGDGGPAGSGGTGSPAGQAGDSFGGQGGEGGSASAIFVLQTAEIIRTTMDGNHTGDGGDGGDAGSTSAGGAFGGGAGGAAGTGGLFKDAFGGSTLTVTNATLSGNSTGDGGDGGDGGDAGSGGDGGSGAAFNSIGSVSGDFTHVTIASNTTGAGGQAGSGTNPGMDGAAGTAGAFSATTGNFTLLNSLIASNTAPQCVGIGIVDGGRNLAFPTGSGCPAVSTANPLLGALADYGGDAPTRSLLAGSPAIDAVPSTGAGCEPTDQREVLRPRGPACDIGAFESARPSAATGAASGVTQTGASLAGSVLANTRPTTYRFAYGKTTAYGALTAPASAGNGTAAVAAAATLTGLEPGTTYHYRLVASNSDGTVNGADRTFTTVAAPVPAPLPAAPFAGLSVLTKSARADSKGRVSLKLRCPAAAVGNCRGKVTLKARIKRKRVTLASARFSIAPGKSKTVRLKLSRKRRGQLRRAKKLKATLSVSAVDSRGGKSRVTSGKLTLKAPKPKP